MSIPPLTFMPSLDLTTVEKVTRKTGEVTEGASDLADGNIFDQQRLRATISNPVPPVGSIRATELQRGSLKFGADGVTGTPPVRPSDALITKAATTPQLAADGTSNFTDDELTQLKTYFSGNNAAVDAVGSFTQGSLLSQWLGLGNQDPATITDVGLRGTVQTNMTNAGGKGVTYVAGTNGAPGTFQISNASIPPSPVNLTPQLLASAATLPPTAFTAAEDFAITKYFADPKNAQTLANLGTITSGSLLARDGGLGNVDPSTVTDPNQRATLQASMAMFDGGRGVTYVPGTNGAPGTFKIGTTVPTTPPNPGTVPITNQLLARAATDPASSFTPQELYTLNTYFAGSNANVLTAAALNNYTVKAGSLLAADLGLGAVDPATIADGNIRGLVQNNLLTAGGRGVTYSPGANGGPGTFQFLPAPRVTIPT